MEESEKRRERLKAIRMEASQAGVDHEAGNSTVSHDLSNPFVETSAIPLLQNNSLAPPRFDYYTDPMSAFSADKRRSKASHQNSQDYFTPPKPRNPETTPSPAHQVQTNYSPDPRMYQPRGPYHGSGPMTPSPAHQIQTSYSPDPRMYRAQGPYHGSGPYGSPIGMVSPSGSHQGAPGVWSGSGGASSYCPPPNSSGVGNFSHPGFGGSPGSNSGQGRGNWFGNSPTSGSGFRGSPTSSFGRGRGRPGRGGQTGFGSYGIVSAELRPDLYYKKSMIEDPWKLLKPVIWKRATSLKIMDSLKTSAPKSVGVKKARISGASNESSSQPSLAEYLAAAFNEAASDGASRDKPGS